MVKRGGEQADRSKEVVNQPQTQVPLADNLMMGAKTFPHTDLQHAHKHLPDAKLHDTKHESPHEKGTRFSDFNFKKDFSFTKTEGNWSVDKAHNAEKLDYPNGKWRIFEKGPNGDLDKVISSDGSVWSKDKKHPDTWTISVPERPGPPKAEAQYYRQKMHVEIDKGTKALHWKIYDNKTGVQTGDRTVDTKGTFTREKEPVKAAEAAGDKSAGKPVKLAKEQAQLDKRHPTPGKVDSTAANATADTSPDVRPMVSLTPPETADNTRAPAPGTGDATTARTTSDNVGTPLPEGDAYTDIKPMVSLTPPEVSFASDTSAPLPGAGDATTTRTTSDNVGAPLPGVGDATTPAASSATDTTPALRPEWPVPPDARLTGLVHDSTTAQVPPVAPDVVLRPAINIPAEIPQPYMQPHHHHHWLRSLGHVLGAGLALAAEESPYAGRFLNQMPINRYGLGLPYQIPIGYGSMGFGPAGYIPGGFPSVGFAPVGYHPSLTTYLPRLAQVPFVTRFI